MHWRSDRLGESQHTKPLKLVPLVPGVFFLGRGYSFGRQKRSGEAAVIYHALNRANDRDKIFKKPAD